jgi:hypothetical protein
VQLFLHLNRDGLLLLSFECGKFDTSPNPMEAELDILTHSTNRKPRTMRRNIGQRARRINWKLNRGKFESEKWQHCWVSGQK